MGALYELAFLTKQVQAGSAHMAIRLAGLNPEHGVASSPSPTWERKATELGSADKRELCIFIKRGVEKRKGVEMGGEGRGEKKRCGKARKSLEREGCGEAQFQKCRCQAQQALIQMKKERL